MQARDQARESQGVRERQRKRQVCLFQVVCTGPPDTSCAGAGCVCVALFYYTDIGESLRSRGQFLTAVDLGWPDPHPPP